MQSSRLLLESNPFSLSLYLKGIHTEPSENDPRGSFFWWALRVFGDIVLRKPVCVGCVQYRRGARAPKKTNSAGIADDAQGEKSAAQSVAKKARVREGKRGQKALMHGGAGLK